jgi:hypothetical protein
MLAAVLQPPDLGNLTATAILGWYAWHTASRTIPELLSAFRQELAAARDEFREERAAFHAALDRERVGRAADSVLLAEAIREMGQGSRVECRSES